MTPQRTGWSIWMIAALLPAWPQPAAAQQLSADDVVAGAVQALGGSEALEAFRTLRFEHFSQGRDVPLQWEIIRPNQVRKDREGEFVLLFDGHRAGFLEGSDQEGGPQGPRLIPEEDWHHFEMDIALYIPAFLDFPAEYAGQATVDGHPAHMLKVSLPMGGSVFYAIDAESFLPLTVEIPDWGLRRRLGDYREVGGVLYPHRFWNPANPDQVMLQERVEVNFEADRSRFVFPADIAAE